MKMKFYNFFLLGAFLLLTGTTATSQSATKANLTAPAEQLLQNYLTTESTLSAKSAQIELDIYEDRLHKKSGLRTIRAFQQLDGIYLLDGTISLHYDKEGKQRPVDRLVDPSPNTTSPSFDASAAIHRTMHFYGMPSTLSLQLKEDKFSVDGEVVFDRGMISASDIKARLVYVIHPQTKELRLTWETQMHTVDRQHYYVSYVDAEQGIVILHEDKVHKCSFGGHEYDASPEEMAQIKAEHQAMHLRAAYDWDRAMEREQSQVTGAGIAPHTYRVLKEPAEAPNDLEAYNTTHGAAPAAGDITYNNILLKDELVQKDVTMADALSIDASPNGWHDNTTATAGATGNGVVEDPATAGNNVYSFYDPSPALLGGAPQPVTAVNSVNGDYLTDWDLEKEPEFMSGASFPNRDAAIVNLFYWNNLIHDVFYEFELTEDGRAFQDRNYGRNGTPDDGENDRVLAQAQDGGGTNNANFLTLRDGLNGQMQMYLWTASLSDNIVQLAGGTNYEAVEGALYSTVFPAPGARVSGPGNGTEVEIVLINDGCSGGATNSSGTTGCGTGVAMAGVGLTPCNNIAGKIVLIDRGSCSFVEKVHGCVVDASNKAAGVIVMNNNESNPDEIISMGGTDASIHSIDIPSVMVSYNTGLLLKQMVVDGQNSGNPLMGKLELTKPATPKKDGDFDNGIIAHEYGHGITTRLSPQTLTGGSLSGNEQGGEGWADYIALYMTTSPADLGPATTEHPFGVLPDRGIGAYIRYTDYDGPGIRPRRYSIDLGVNPYTFAGSSNGGLGIGNAPEVVPPHGVGFVWCTMLWEMTQKLVDIYGISKFEDDSKRLFNAPDGIGDMISNDGNGNVIPEVGKSDAMNLAMRLILRGIQNQPPSPTFIEMRNGILEADDQLFGGVHKCAIWEAFAKRGLGVDATDVDNVIGNEADGYAVPSSCLPAGSPVQIFYSIEKTAETVKDNQEDLVYTIKVTNTSPTNEDASGVMIEDVLPAEAVIQSAGDNSPTLNIQTAVDNGLNKATWTITTLPAGETAELTVTANLQSTVTSKIIQEFTFETGDEGWIGSGTGSNNAFSLRMESEDDNVGAEDGDTNNPGNGRVDAHGGVNYFHTPNTGGFIVSPELESAYLTSPTITAGVNRQLRFWHQYSTDSGYDGGFVEVSTDGGSSWSKITIEDNPYTGSLNGTFNPLNAGAAYTGASPYIESAAFISDDVTNVRFAFSEDTGGGSGNGWWIDDIKIVENPVIITNEVSITDVTGGRTKTASASTLILGEPVTTSVAVRLIDLKANARKDDIQLTWATASEVDNKGFHVERLNDDNTWSAIGFVEGQGTTSSIVEYTFLDADVTVNKVYTYRLRQVDFNGEETLSNKVTARIIGTAVNMNIVPNPATDKTNVRIENASVNSQLRVLSVAGQLVRTYNLDEASRQTVSVDISDLAAGIYMIQLQTNDGLLVQKLIVE